MPRVVTGEFRGTILLAPKGDNTRPTTDKVKEALFSMIQTRVPAAKVLDIFAGTGQIAIEAISRGADKAVMVERAGQACGIIKKNLEKIRADSDPRFELMRMTFNQALSKLGERGEKFDIIFMDPPYKDAQNYCEQIADLVNTHNLLEDDGILICEHASDTEFETSVINLQFNRSCSYGLSVLTFFCKENDEGEVN